MPIKYANLAGGGDGSSTASPWTIQQAFTNAISGDIVYIENDDYGNINLTQNTDGTFSLPITFIGTNGNWNPFNAIAGSTYTRTDAFSSVDMPFLDGGLTDGNRASNGTAININGDHVIVKNISVKGFERGIAVNGSYCTLDNVNSDFLGDMRLDNSQHGFDYYLGVSLDLQGNNNKVYNSFHRDSDAEGVKIRGNHHELGYIEVYTSKNIGNTTDYQFLFQIASNCKATNITVIREAGTAHFSHGICFKPTGGVATNNVVDGFYIENSRVEYQFSGTYGNTVRNGVINATATIAENEQSSSGLSVLNGAHDNLTENVRIYDAAYAFFFSEWDDLQPESAGDSPFMGQNNKFVNITVHNAWQAVIYLAFTNSGGVGGVTNTQFYNLSINDSARFIRVVAPNDGMKFYNCTMNGFSSAFKLEGGGHVLNPNTVFRKINKIGANTPDFTVYDAQSSDITSVPFAYTDAPNGDFSITDNALEIGGDFSNLEPRQGFDFNGHKRTDPFTIGAFDVDLKDLLKTKYNSGIGF